MVSSTKTSPKVRSAKQRMRNANTTTKDLRLKNQLLAAAKHTRHHPDEPKRNYDGPVRPGSRKPSSKSTVRIHVQDDSSAPAARSLTVGLPVASDTDTIAKAAAPGKNVVTYLSSTFISPMYQVVKTSSSFLWFANYKHEVIPREIPHFLLLPIQDIWLSVQSMVSETEFYQSLLPSILLHLFIQAEVLVPKSVIGDVQVLAITRNHVFPHVQTYHGEEFDLIGKVLDEGVLAYDDVPGLFTLEQMLTRQGILPPSTIRSLLQLWHSDNHAVRNNFTLAHIQHCWNQSNFVANFTQWQREVTDFTQQYLTSRAFQRATCDAKLSGSFDINDDHYCYSNTFTGTVHPDIPESFVLKWKSGVSLVLPRITMYDRFKAIRWKHIERVPPGCIDLQPYFDKKTV